MNQDFKPRRRIEEDYYRDILSFLKHSFDIGQGVSARLLSATEFINKYSWQAARRMVLGLNVDNARSWREAARQSMQGNRIHQALLRELNGPVGERMRQLIERNAQLIRTLPVKIAEQVTAKVAEAGVAGERPEAFSSSLLSHFTRTHARLIARTETSKASTALTQARSEDLGLAWWVWRTAEDARVRLSHRKMQGVLVSWGDLPSPEQLAGEHSYGHYAAGNIFNCFPGNTLVDPTYCEVLFRSWYEGTVVDIESDARSSAFTATANHPVLTSRGWVDAGNLNQGDKLANELLDDSKVLKNNHQKKLISFDDLFESLLLSGSPQSNIEALRFNFYGEVPVSEVRAIRPKHNLSLDSDERLRNQFFPAADCGIMSSSYGILGQIFESDFSSFGDKSNSVSSRESTHPQLVGISDRSDSDAFNSKVLVDSFGGSQVLATEDDCTLPPLVFSDNVLNVRRRQFSGHVYTLQSPTGVYSINERRIIVKNCRCYPEPVLYLDQISWPHKCYTGGRVRYTTRAEFRNIARIPIHQEAA